MTPPKKALGRGLTELIPELEKEISLFEKPSGDLQISFLPLEKIKFSSYQVRKDLKEDSSFQELLLSIKKRGILQPILVRPLEDGNYECVAGERRLRASMKLGLKEIPAIIKQLSEEEVLLVGLIENIQRKNLNPIEEALGYKILIEKFGYTQEEVAEKVGKDRTTIANLLRLLKLPSLIQEDLIAGKITIGHAKILLSLDSEKDQLFLRNLILKKHLSVRETELYLKKFFSQTQKASPKSHFMPVEEKLKNLIQEISHLTNFKVKVKFKGRKTCFIFEFEDQYKAESFITTLKNLLTH